MFQGSPDDFREGFAGLVRHIQAAGFDPTVFASQYSRDTALMTRAYLDRRDEIEAAPDPLWMAADIALAGRVKEILPGRSTG